MAATAAVTHLGGAPRNCEPVAAHLPIPAGRRVITVHSSRRRGSQQPRARRAEIDRTATYLGYVTQRADTRLLTTVYTAANAGQPAWIVYPKPGCLGTDVDRLWLFRALHGHGVCPISSVSAGDTWDAVLLRTGIYTDADAAEILAWPAPARRRRRKTAAPRHRVSTSVA